MEQKTLGRYRIIGELGRGAMGAVYRAVDPLIEREVAIKTLLPNLPEDVMGEVRERFVREARSAGRLNHPNIVTIFDVGEHEGVAYIAMELLEGRSLQQILRDSARLPFAAAADIAAQVADALDVAQQYKIVHRDVKPANIMVGPAGRVKLADFGVARVDSSSMTQTGTALGSPRYMSPEQVLGLPIDPRSDLFSLGVVLYEMLVRRTPFERPTDTTVFALMNRIAGEPHAPVHEVDPQVPAAFDLILARALAKKPEQRYARAAEMAADLRNWQGLAPKAGDAPYDKTMVVSRPAPAAPAPAREDDRAKTQLIDDLDAFARRFEAEERQRLREEEAERLRKEEEVRRWAETEARKRAEFERKRDAEVAAATDPAAATRRRSALDALKQKAAAQPARESPAAVRARALAALDQALRAGYQYLAEVVREVNSVSPVADRPYDFLYVGRLPAVALSEGFVDSRPLRIDGKDMCERLILRYRITPAKPAVVSLLGPDIARCEQYLQMMKTAFKMQPEQKNDFGQVTKARFTVTGSLPCEVLIRGDYEDPGIAVELTNVRRFGRHQGRLGIEQFNDVVDDLARYILGVDEDFEKVLQPRRQV